MALDLTSKVHALVLALKPALTIFGIIFKRKKDNEISNSYNHKLIIILQPPA